LLISVQQIRHRRALCLILFWLKTVQPLEAQERICSLGFEKYSFFCIFLTITIEIVMLVPRTIYLTYNKWLGREGVDSWSMNLLGSK
jgi:hypothetical protein